MAMFSRMLLALLLAGMLLPLAPRSASACSCPALSGDEQLVRRLLDSADAVVVAKIQAIDSVTPNEIVARAETKLVYSGDAPRSLEVRTRGDSASCGYPELTNGGDHLMFLSRDDDYYRTELCSAFPVRFDEASRQVATNTGAEFLATLTSVAPPEASSFPSATRGGNEPSGRTQLIVGSIFVAAALVVGLVALRRLQADEH